MAWKYLTGNEFCPLCNKKVKLVWISWLYNWARCEYCLLKLPASKKIIRALQK